MKRHQFSSGANCVMLAPYTHDNQIDYNALDKMVEWYVQRGIGSLFAMCQSTEQHLLTMEERLGVVRFVKQKCESLTTWWGKRPDVIAAGTFSTDICEMADQIHAMNEVGADAVVWLTNRLARQDEPDAVWLENAQRLLAKLDSDIALGMYECPHPYKRLLTQDDLRWALSTERFYFIKDTCCDPDLLKDRLDLVRGTQLKLFNANAQTLLHSLRYGGAGYSGVMANVHPQLYAWLCEYYEEFPELAERVQEVVCFSAFTESLPYPLTAKYIMNKQGVPIQINSRVRAGEKLTSYHTHIMDQVEAQTEAVYSKLPEARTIG